MRTIQRMRVERLYSQFESVGTPRAHEWSSVNVDHPCDEVQLVLPKAECTSKRRVLRTLEIQCNQQVTFCDVHNNAVCSDRGQPLLSDQGGEL